MNGRFIYVTYQRLDERDLDRFGVNMLRSRHHKVEVWDVSPLLLPPEGCSREEHTSLSSPCRNRLTFKKRSQIAGELSRLSGDDIVILLVPFELSSLFLFRAVSRSRSRYAILAVGNVVAAKADLEWGIGLFVLKLSMQIRRISLRRLLDRLILRLPIQWLGVREADYCVLIGGAEAKERALLIGAATRLVRCHSFDYDLFLMRRPAPAVVDLERYVVFIDEGVPYHEEYELLGIRRPIEANTYYPCLRRFFEAIEKKYGWPVVIAESPRYRYPNDSSHFGRRRIVRGDTCNLIRDAQFVITHASTAVSYAVIHKKPLVFTTYDPDCRTVLGADILAMARYFGQSPVPLTKAWRESMLAVEPLDESRYQTYFHRYIKDRGTPDSSIWETFEQAVANPPPSAGAAVG